MKQELEVMEWNGSRKNETEELTPEERRRRRNRLKARKLAAKRRRRKRLIKRVLVIVAVIGMVIAANEFELLSKAVTKIEINKTDTLKRDTFLYEIEYENFLRKTKPQTLSEEEVAIKLKELAKEYEELEQIYEERERYPIKLLAALCNNPELTEYVKGYLAYHNGDRSVMEEPVLTKEEQEQKYPLFLQWDKRWGYEAYGDFNIGLSGCGPTALSMAAVILTGDTSVTPDKVADYSMKHGYYVEGTGTAWSLMTEGCEKFGISAEEIPLDEFVMKNQLEEGKVMICSVRQGDFTALGHFILIYDYDENGFWVNDPNCIYRSSRPWTYEELKSQIRILWAYERVG